MFVREAREPAGVEYTERLRAEHIKALVSVLAHLEQPAFAKNTEMARDPRPRIAPEPRGDVARKQRPSLVE
jgi:hypothetical protein